LYDRRVRLSMISSEVKSSSLERNLTEACGDDIRNPF
jgi:hypothetical protein